jgi:Cys-rich protein (TIGR01571 family)
MECSKYGFCHPICCLAFWCGPCALGQVMTRMKLDACGEPVLHTIPQTFCSTFKTLFTFTAIVWTISLPLAIFLICALAYYNNMMKYYSNHYSYYGYYDPFLEWCYYYQWLFVWILFPVVIGWWIYFVVVMRRTRKFIRERYVIEGDCCGDCCQSCCCIWCTTAQMSSHTVDYNRHRASCCNDIGLMYDIEDPEMHRD